MHFFNILVASLNLLISSFLGIQQDLNKAATTGSVLSLGNLAANFDIHLVPVRRSAASDPIIEARSAAVVDQDSGQMLWSKNASEKLPPASITKLMTALVVLERDNLNDVVTVPFQATQVSGSRMYLLAGEKIQVQDLLKGLLIVSANDAAVALALHTSGTLEAFVEAMNDFARYLGLEKTRFTDPHGLDAANRSTSREIALLARATLQDSRLAEIIKTRETTVRDVSRHFSHSLKTTNQLLGSYLNIIGGKTGTLESGESLVVAAQGENDQVVIAVVLKSPDRFQEARDLLDWALKSYIWIERL